MLTSWPKLKFDISRSFQSVCVDITRSYSAASQPRPSFRHLEAQIAALNAKNGGSP
jgi:hypothetical protein